MHKKVNVLVVTGYGTNCERETAYAARQAGADQVIMAHFSDLLTERYLIPDFNLLVFPGGFLDGDNLGAAQAAAQRLKYARTCNNRSLMQDIYNMYKQGGLLLGICNGFQLLVKLGLLPALGANYPEKMVSLSYNDSARFEDRWTYLTCNPASPCIFTKGLENMYLPVRHGEGKLEVLNKDTLKQLEDNELIAMQYTDEQGRVTQQYPLNPNGSPLGIAGLTDPSGQIFGLMPHPEAYNHPTNHPAWTRGKQALPGTAIFANAVDHLQNRN